MANDIAYANLNTLAASTGPKYIEGRIEDIFFDAHPILNKIRDNGNIKKGMGTGKTLVLDLRIGSNPTIAARSIDEVVPLQQTETVTTAEWSWGSLTGSIVFNDSQLHDNMGKQQLANILQLALDQATDTWAEVITNMIAAQTSADSPFNFLGLKDGVTDGTWAHPASYGGLTPAAYSGWAAHVQNNASTLPNLLTDMDHAYNSASYGTIQPDILWTDQTGEEIYRGLMDSNIRYTDVQVGDAVINAVVFRGKPLVFDRHITSITATPSGSGGIAWSGTNDTASTHRIYMLNTKYWEFHFDSEWNMDNAIEKQWRIPVDQFKRTKLIALRGQLITRQRRYQSVVTNIPTS